MGVLFLNYSIMYIFKTNSKYRNFQRYDIDKRSSGISFFLEQWLAQPFPSVRRPMSAPLLTTAGPLALAKRMTLA